MVSARYEKQVGKQEKDLIFKEHKGVKGHVHNV